MTPREMLRAAPMALERGLHARGFRAIAGVDEVGRGCWAGPVVAAAVIMPRRSRLPQVNDSKLLSAAQRQELAARIRQVATSIGIGVASAADIDATDILRATHAAMCAALEQLNPPPDFILVDGRSLPPLSTPCQAIVDGDCHSYSIAAASIIAKVYRDALMIELDARYPGYGFANHKGYGTLAHRRAIEALGPCPEHRLSFEPLKSRGQRRLDL